MDDVVDGWWPDVEGSGGVAKKVGISSLSKKAVITRRVG